MKYIFLTLIAILTFTVYTSCSDDGDDPPPVVPLPTNLQVDVDITGQSDQAPYGDGSGQVTLTATADNATSYRIRFEGADVSMPNGTYTVVFDLHCTGTVPVHFTTPMLWGDVPPGEITFTVYDQAGYLIPLDQLQLHPGEMVYGELTIHLNNDAIQDYFYYFWVDFMYYQYNEPPY